jgi:hypothetical protein
LLLFVSVLDPAGRTLARENRDDKLPNFLPEADASDSLGEGDVDRVEGGLGDKISGAANGC